jgi:hypothetical protein
MRFILVLLILALAVYKLWPDKPTPKVEETFIAPHLETMNKAEQIEEQYMEALERTNERIERESDGG